MQKQLKKESWRNIIKKKKKKAVSKNGKNIAERDRNLE